MKNIKNKLVLLIVSLFMAFSTCGMVFNTAYATGKTEIDPSGSMIYTETLYLEYAEDEVYMLDFRMNAKVNVASFNLVIQMPEFITIDRVDLSEMLDSLANSNFEYVIDGGGCVARISFTSAEDFIGDVTLFSVNYTLNAESVSGNPSLMGDCMFTNTNYEYFTNVGCAFGEITVGSAAESVMKGDVDQDGRISLADLVIMQRYIIGSDELLGDGFTAADIDNSGMVDTMDCQYVQMFLVGQLASLDGIGDSSEDPGKYFWVDIFFLDTDGKIILSNEVYMYTGELLGQRLGQEARNKGYNVVGAYYDQGLKETIGDTDIVNDSITVYVVVDNTVSESISVTVHCMSTNVDGSIYKFDTIYMNLQEGAYLLQYIHKYSNLDNYSFVKACDDAEGQNEISKEYRVYSSMEVYAFYERTVRYSLECHYMTVSGESILQIGGMYTEVVEGSSLYSYGQGMYGECELAGAYYDENFTNPVGENDTISQNTKLYIKAIAPDRTGTYVLYSMDMGENGPEFGTEEIGTVTIDGSILSITRDDVTVSGTYQDLGGVLQVLFNEQHLTIISLNESKAYLYYEFDGSSYPEDASVKAVVGNYKFVVEEQNFNLELYSNAVFNMSYQGNYILGRYTYNPETNIISLNVMGESAQLLYDPKTESVTPVIEESGSGEGGSGEVDTPTVPDLTGNYDLYATTMSDNGPVPGDEIIGSVTIDGSTLSITRGDVTVSGTYQYLGGMCQMMVSDYHTVMVYMSNGKASLYYEFDGSSFSENPSVAAVVGNYDFVMYNQNYNLMLLSNAVYDMSFQGMHILGDYTYDAETNIISLNAMGTSQQLIYDPETKSVTPVIEESGVNEDGSLSAPEENVVVENSEIAYS